MEKQIDKVLKGIKIIAIICGIYGILAIIWDFNLFQIEDFNFKFMISSFIVYFLVVISDLNDKEYEGWK